MSYSKLVALVLALIVLVTFTPVSADAKKKKRKDGPDEPKARIVITQESAKEL